MVDDSVRRKGVRSLEQSSPDTQRIVSGYMGDYFEDWGMSIYALATENRVVSTEAQAICLIYTDIHRLCIDYACISV